MSESDKTNWRKESKLQLITLLKQLMMEDPIIAIVFVTTFLPIVIQLLDAVAKADNNRAILMVLVLSAITVIVIIPLLIVRIWRAGKTAETKSMTKNAKLNRKRFDQLMTAKIDTVIAEKDFIFSQNDRYERLVILESARDIREGMDKQFDNMSMKSIIASTETCNDKFTKLMASFRSVQEAADKLLEINGEKKTDSEFPDITISDNIEDKTEYIPDPRVDKVVEENNELKKQNAALTEQFIELTGKFDKLRD